MTAVVSGAAAIPRRSTFAAVEPVPGRWIERQDVSVVGAARCISAVEQHEAARLPAPENSPDHQHAPMATCSMAVTLGMGVNPEPQRLSSDIDGSRESIVAAVVHVNVLPRDGVLRFHRVRWTTAGPRDAISLG